VTDLLKPAADWELQSLVATCRERRLPIEVAGAGTKRSLGRPMQTAVTISTQSMRGISLYEPNELVMSARAGTPLSQVEATLAARGQMLAFEPIDLGPAIGNGAGGQTIGAVFAVNLSGARRVVAGAARDHLIGLTGVNGAGEMFKSGGRVMKNVTGYDVARGLTGSWGTLAFITEATFKVLPWPESQATLVFKGLPDDLAVEVMCAALGTPYEVSGAVHLTAVMAGRLESKSLNVLDKSLTLLRIENFSRSVAYRTDVLRKALSAFGVPAIIEQAESQALWAELRRLSVVTYSDSLLWRISTAPKTGPKIVAQIRRQMPAEAFYDWSGGLIWLETPVSADAGAADIRRAMAVHGGYATLVRAAPEIRAAVEVFHPLSPGVERLTRGLKAVFDPDGLLNPGRMYSYV
jgi:glycolate oxidase FAD binding subunit